MRGATLGGQLGASWLSFMCVFGTDPVRNVHPDVFLILWPAADRTLSLLVRLYYEQRRRPFAWYGLGYDFQFRDVASRNTNI